MVRDLVLTLVLVIVENQFTFIARKYCKTLDEAVVSVTRITSYNDYFRNFVSRNFFAPPGFVSHIARYGEEKRGRFSDVGTDHFRNLPCNSINRHVSKIFSVVKPVGYEDSDQRSTNVFILDSRGVAVSIEPGQENVEWLL